MALLVLITSLQGVVNRYMSVVEVDRCRNFIRTADTSQVLERDSLVIIIQMQGASTDQCGLITSMGTAGRFEQNTVERVSGDTVFFRYTLLTSYDPNGATQLVTMPQYDVVRTSDVLRPMPWDGNRGGVLALSVRDTLYLDSSITASGSGFRAHEGVAGPSADVMRRMANGAGGTSGAAHVGCGGETSSGSCPAAGQALSYSAGVNWLFMGGGATASGGGIVIIDAPVIVGSGKGIISSDGSRGDGGAAGGALLITASSLINIPELSVRGGDAVNGGGGGGAIRLGTISPLNLNPSAYGGGASQRGSAYDGCSGGLYYNVTINKSTSVFRPASVVYPADTTLCQGASVALEVDGALSAVWMINDDTVATTTSITHVVDTTVTYTVLARYSTSCWDTARVTVTAEPPPTIDLGPDVETCPSIPVTLTAPPGYAEYLWSTGATSPSISTKDSGAYYCTVRTIEGCEGADTVVVHHKATRPLSIIEVPTNDIYIELPTVTAGEISSRVLTLQNNTDTTVTLNFATLSTNVRFSFPLSQFPLTIPARTTRPLTIIGDPVTPGEHSDKALITDPCGDITFFVKVFGRETEWVTRCGVRITSEGELQEALIHDMLGRVVREPLSPGIYHVVTPTWSGLVMR